MSAQLLETRHVTFRENKFSLTGAELKKEDMTIEKITETERFSVFYSIRAEIGWGNE